MAFLAVFDLQPHGYQRTGQQLGLIFIAFQEVKYQTQGRFLANAGQLRYLIYRFFN